MLVLGVQGAMQIIAQVYSWDTSANETHAECAVNPAICLALALQQYLEQIKADPEVCAISGQPPPAKKQRTTPAPSGACCVGAAGWVGARCVASSVAVKDGYQAGR